ncbi:MAG: sulfur carrier protein ThiS [Abditibacteriota bacterium]|nr:sulfur carrier protein ThiS [Abditibacteriota bacterium]
MVKINGKDCDMDGKTVAEAIGMLGYDPRRVACELNEAIVPLGLFGDTVLKDGDSLEIVSFVGGG